MARTLVLPRHSGSKNLLDWHISLIIRNVNLNLCASPALSHLNVHLKYKISQTRGFFAPLCKDYCAPTTGFSACDKESIRMQYGCDKDAVRKQWLLKESKKIWDSWKEFPKDLFQTDADHISVRHRPRSSAILSDKLSWVQMKPSFYGYNMMAEVKEGSWWALQESD